MLDVLLNEIFPNLDRFAEEKKMQVLHEEYYPTTFFGNALFELSASTFFIRITRDRSQAWAHVSPRSEKDWYQLGDESWHYLDTIIRFLEGRPAWEQHTWEENAANLNAEFIENALSRHYQEIGALMKEDLTVAGFTAFEQLEREMRRRGHST